MGGKARKLHLSPLGMVDLHHHSPLVVLGIAGNVRHIQQGACRNIGLAQNVHGRELVVILQPFPDGSVADIPVGKPAAGRSHFRACILL